MHTLANILRDGDPAAVVALDGDRCYRRAAWLSGIAALAKTLQARSEPRWLLLHDNSYRFSIGLFALLAAGKQVILPPNAQPGTLAALGDLPLLSPDNIATDSDPASLPLLDTGNLYITVLTSGSTGAAKAISKPLRCFDDELVALEQMWGTQLGQAVIFSSVSHQHVYGLLFRLLWPLVAGRPFAATTQPYPESLVAAWRQQPRAALVSSPALLARFPPSIDLAADSERLVAVFSSGGLLPPAAAQTWQQRLGQPPLEILGSSETGGVAWRQQHTGHDSWQPLPGVSVQLQDDAILAVRSPFTGDNDWLAMGDRAVLQDDGGFHLLGRADTIVKIGEKRLSLTAMECALATAAMVSAARIVPLPDDSNRLGAVVILSAAGTAFLQQHGKHLLVDQLRTGLLEQFERVTLPRKWRFPAGLPHNHQGKTTMDALQQLFREKQLLNEKQPLRENRDPPAANILEHSAAHRTVQWQFAEDCGLFDGHFPGLPILPGVVQFDLAVRQCESWYPLTHFRRIDRLKFQEPVVPGDTVTLALENNGTGQVNFQYRLDGQPLSSGRIIFAGDNANA